MPKYDHFHCIYKYADQDGVEHKEEIEGGLGADFDIEEARKWDDETREKWEREQAVAWGMPENAEIIRIWVAG